MANLTPDPPNDKTVQQSEHRTTRARGLFKTLFLDIRGEALWDAIKNSPKLYAYFVGGWTVIGTGLTAVFQRWRGLPPDTVGILILAVIWMLILSIVFLIGRLRARGAARQPSTVQPESPAPAAGQISAAEVEELQARVKQQQDDLDAVKREAEQSRIEAARQQRIANDNSVRADVKESVLGQYKWLHDVAGTQSMDIDEYVTLEKVRLEDSDLDDPVPYVRFSLHITNHSVFEITVELTGGYIEFGGRRLRYQPEVLYNDLRNARFGKKGCITLKQHVSSEEADLIKSSTDKADANFYFDGLVLTITADKHYPKADLKQLIITKGTHVSGGPLTFKVGGSPRKPLVITRALYWVDDDMVSDVTKIVESLVSNGSLTITGKYKDIFFPDPKKGVRKHLTIEYVHDGQQFAFTAQEDTTFTLPLPYGKGR